MIGIINFEAFLLAGILLNLTPGADTMYILGRSISQGKKAGIVSALGISTGGLVHCLFAAFGLSMVLAQSAMAFELIKYLGAIYLIYLGVKSLTSKSKKAFALDGMNVKQEDHKRIYLSGIFTNVLNPKVALFFLAFLPQFIDPNFEGSVFPFVVLGFTFLSIGTIWCLVLALFSARLSDKIRNNYKIKIWLDRISGGVFILLGIKLALTRK